MPGHGESRCGGGEQAAKASERGQDDSTGSEYHLHTASGRPQTKEGLGEGEQQGRLGSQGAWRKDREAQALKEQLLGQSGYHTKWIC